jgi:glycosyltransferase involved in cell wall biosynthesis
MKNKYLIFLSTAAHAGGGEIVLNHLIPELIRNHSDYIIKVLIPEGDAAEVLKKNIKVTAYSGSSLFKIISALNKLIDIECRNCDDLYIVSCSPKALRAVFVFKMYLRFKNRALSQKTISHFYSHSKRGFLTSLFIAHASSAIISVSKNLQKKFTLLGGRSIWVPNSTKLNMNTSLEKDDHQTVSNENLTFINKLKNGRTLFIFLGRICHAKGVETLINAAEILDSRKTQDSESDPLILVAGKRMFSSKSSSEQRLNNYNGSSLKYAGYIEPETLPFLLEHCTALVLPSLDEQFPICILEAQACSLPVIATPVGDIPEMIRHNKEGLLIPVNNPLELANSILLLAHDTGHAKKMGIQGKKRFKTLFSFDKWAARFMDALKS